LALKEAAARAANAAPQLNGYYWEVIRAG